MHGFLSFLVSTLTSQDALYKNMSSLEAIWVIALALTLVVCVWGIWDTFGDLYYRLERNRYDRKHDIPLSGIARAANIRAWANIRNAIVWIAKAFLYEVVGILAALAPPNPNPSPARTLFPIIFLILGGLLVYQVFAERRDRQRTWNAIGLQSREGFPSEETADLAIATLAKVDKVDDAVHVNIELTQKAVKGQEGVRVAIERMGTEIQGVQVDQAIEKERRESDDKTGTP